MDLTECFPVEILHMIFSFLPISDMWRLRSVSPSWNSYLCCEDSHRAIVKRWNTHSQNQQALIDGPEPTLAQELDRIEHFLQGRPFAITRYTRDDERLLLAARSGKWLIFHYKDSHGLPHLQVVDLLSHRERHIAIGNPHDNIDVVMSGDQVACLTTSTITYRAGPFNLHLLDLTVPTLSARQYILPPLSSVHEDEALSMDQHHVLLVCYSFKKSPSATIDFFICSGSSVWRFQVNSVTKHTEVVDFTIDSEQGLVMWWSIITSDNEAGDDTFWLQLQRYTLDGTLYSLSKWKLIPQQHAQSLLSRYFPVWLNVRRAATSGSWSVELGCELPDEDDLDTCIIINPDAPASTTPHLSSGFGSWVRIWKDVTISIVAPTYLCFSRRCASMPIAVSHLSLKDDLADFWMPQLFSIDDTFLMVNCSDWLEIFTFDKRAADLMSLSETSTLTSQPMALAGLTVITTHIPPSSAVDPRAHPPVWLSKVQMGTCKELKQDLRRVWLCLEPHEDEVEVRQEQRHNQPD